MKKQIKYSVGADSLLKILELSLETESSYEQLKTKTKNLYLKDWLTVKQELTTDFILSILTKLQEFEIPPQSHSLMKVKLNKLWLDMKLRFISIDNNLIVRECHKIDKGMLNALHAEMKSGVISNKIHELYQHHINKLSLYNNPVAFKESISYPSSSMLKIH